MDHPTVGELDALVAGAGVVALDRLKVEQSQPLQARAHARVAAERVRSATRGALEVPCAVTISNAKLVPHFSSAVRAACCTSPRRRRRRCGKELRGGALGVAFKRQVVLGGRYIVDFFAPSIGLVVEVAGAIHRVSRSADRRRDERLRRLGYRVVRVEAGLVLRNPRAALAFISAALPR